jgi:dihydrofolate reductase
LTNLPISTHRTFLIGGSQLYSLAFSSSPPLVTRVLLTRILSDFECDTYLEDFAAQDKRWTLANHAELSQWVGFDVPEGEIEEKGTRYRFEMWILKE